MKEENSMNKRFDEILDKYISLFHERKLNCSETVLSVINEYYDLGADGVPRIATTFGGGMCGLQMTCGALTGALMAIGLMYGREAGGDRMPSYEKGREFFSEMRKKLPGFSCSEITGIDMSDPVKQAAFSAPGGGHDTVCEPLVSEVCRVLVEILAS